MKQGEFFRRFSAVLFILCAALFSVSCQLFDAGDITVSESGAAAESLDPGKENSQQSSQPEEMPAAVSGEILDAAMHSLVILDDTGQELSFSMDGDTDIAGYVELGAFAEVIYLKADGQLLKAVSVRVTAPPEKESSDVSEPDSQETSDEILSLLNQMSLEEKVGQMFFVRCPPDAEAEAAAYQFGGYILFGRDFADKTPEQVRKEIQSYQDSAKIPMLIGVDEEGGTVNRVSLNPNFRAVPFWSPRDLYAYGGMDLLKSNTQEQCQLLASVGINVNFAPVCDISQNVNDFMYARSLGEDARITSEYIRMSVEVYLQNGVGCVLKHFPGYGNNVDTHTGIAYDSRTMEEFRSKDFLPFSAGIQAGAPCVLVSHNVVNSMDSSLPASLSPAVHEILREELEFDGVIITDDLSMGAIKEYIDTSAAAVQAVKAGNDLLCCTDYEVQFPAVVAAVQTGEISEAQIDASVFRILQWKRELNLI